MYTILHYLFREIYTVYPTSSMKSVFKILKIKIYIEEEYKHF